MLGAKAADFLILKDKKTLAKEKTHISPLRKRTCQFSVNVYDVTAF